MTIPHFKKDQFVDYLKSKGCNVVSDENWNDFDRIMIDYNGITFPLQMSCKVYYFFTVCKICEEIGIDAPDEFESINNQIKKMRADA
jgi:hypothetical protein